MAFAINPRSYTTSVDSIKPGNRRHTVHPRIRSQLQTIFIGQ